jgi:hypothetical protein
VYARNIHDGTGAPLLLWQVFFENIAKMNEFAQLVSVHKCNNLRHNESHRLVATVLVESSQSREIQNILLKTIAAAVSLQPQWTSLIHAQRTSTDQLEKQGTMRVDKSSKSRGNSGL